MKKLYIDNKGDIVIKNVFKPLMDDNGCLVKVRFSLISSGTELMVIEKRKFDGLSIFKKFIISTEFRKIVYSKIKGNNLKELYRIYKSFKGGDYRKNFTDPLQNMVSIGYSCSGMINESNISELKKNDRVACVGANHAEYIYGSKNLLCHIPKNVELEEASFVAVGAIALHAMHRADIKPGEFVGIIGSGLIGLILLQLLKLSNVRVFTFDLIKERLDLSKELGANYTFNILFENIEEMVLSKTNGRGLDKIIICASSKTSKPLNDAVNLIRKKGKIIIVGAFPIEINRTILYEKEADILISRSYGPGRYDKDYEEKGIDYPVKYVPFTVKRNMQLFLELLSQEKINLKPLISNIINIKDADLAYDQLKQDPINNIAILLDYSNIEKMNKINQNKSEFDKIEDKLTIGLIGCGSFAQKVHLPILLTHPKCRIKAIATKSQNSAKNCQEKYHPDYVSTNYKEIINDPDINTVFIYTRHNTHAQITIEALEANKNVFVEKPMGLNLEECKMVLKYVEKTNKNYSIGFNRRFSPIINITKNLLSKRNNPIVINYRISNSFISGNHWLFDSKVGGGPILGEVCHFTDIILYLINSKPIEIQAVGDCLSHKNLEVYDAFTAIIRFENGSIANIIYNFLGSPNLPKERIEIFSGDSSIIIDDFKKMNTDGFDCGNFCFSTEQKGYSNLIKNVINSNLEKIQSKVSVKDAIKAMIIVFKIKESIINRNIIDLSENIYFGN